jgi:two-component system, sensor histidine kinase PdtaS
MFIRITTLFVAFLIGLGCIVKAQGTSMTFNEKNRSTQAASASKETLNRLIELSNTYISKPGEVPSDLDKALELAGQAKKMSLQLHDRAMFYESLLAIGKAHIEKGDAGPAFAMLEQMNDTTRIRMLRTLGAYYYYGGALSKNMDSAAFCLSKAISIAKAGGYAMHELQVRKEFCIYYSWLNDWQPAIEHMIGMLALKHLMKPEDVLERYYKLSICLNNFGEPYTALRYALEGKAYAEKNGNARGVIEMYEIMASTYSKISEYRKAAEMYDIILDWYRKTNNYQKVWMMLDWQVTCYLRLSTPEKALQAIVQTEKEIGCPNIAEQFIYKKNLGRIYGTMNRNDLAEKNYMETLDLANKLGREDAILLNVVARFYVANGQFEKARAYAVKALSIANKKPVPGVLSIIYQNMYKIDSATQQHASALHYYVKRQHIEDSMLRAEKTKQMQSLLVQFEAEKKDRDIKLKGQEILLLSRQHQLQQKDLERARLQVQYEMEAKQQGIQLVKAEAAEKDKDIRLKNQDIELLKKEAQLKQSNLSTANVARNVTIVGAGLLLIILSLVYYQYRLKKRMSVTLSGKNAALENLLQEKELLLKEVHHRVKNNLHTIISLLETQSAFLTDDALAAIQNSQHRVYAMSLIHQKLYQVENSTSVDMASYLPELLSYLKDSFCVDRQIMFRTHIENIQLDVSQAIPIGLILNEAITNAIKYAFPGNRPGEIEISMTRHRERQVCLSVSDNGIGLPGDWQKKTGNSLGLKLMQGLSEDIQGSFNIQTIKGTTVTVAFRKELYSNTAQKTIQSPGNG